MTKYELMVIAAAAAAFVIINIIMWSIIAAKEKRARRRIVQHQRKTDVMTVPANVSEFPETAQEQQQMPSPPQPVKERPRVKCSDFILIDDIVIVHTDERI